MLFYLSPNIPNKALITWFVTQFNVIKVIYISKVAGVRQILIWSLSVTNCFWWSVVANCFKVNTKQLFSDILCFSLKLLSIINNKLGFNDVVDSPRLVEVHHFSYVFLKQQQIETIESRSLQLWVLTSGFNSPIYTNHYMEWSVLLQNAHVESCSYI